MEATFKLDNPDDMRATMSLTMTLREWKELRARLSAADYDRHTSILESHIWQLIEQAEKAFTTEATE